MFGSILSGLGSLVQSGVNMYQNYKASKQDSSTTGTDDQSQSDANQIASQSTASNSSSSGVSALSSIGQGIDSYISQKQELKRYKEQMEREDNSYQRAVADMNAAGINEASAFSGSGSASSSSATYDSQAYLNAAQISSGVQLNRAQANLANAQANLANEEAGQVTPNAESQRSLNQATIDKYTSDVHLNNEQIKKLTQEIRNLKADEIGKNLSNLQAEQTLKLMKQQVEAGDFDLNAYRATGLGPESLKFLSNMSDVGLLGLAIACIVAGAEGESYDLPNLPSNGGDGFSGSDFTTNPVTTDDFFAYSAYWLFEAGKSLAKQGNFTIPDLNLK